MLTEATWDKLVSELYKELDPSMTTEEFHDKLREFIKKYDVEDSMDLVTIGIFAGDVWRPMADDEDEGEAEDEVVDD